MAKSALPTTMALCATPEAATPATSAASSAPTEPPTVMATPLTIWVRKSRISVRR